MKTRLLSLALLLSLATLPAQAQYTFTGLGDLSGGTFFSTALGLSSNGGTVVGQSTSASGDEAFRWTPGGGLVGMGDLAGGGFASSAGGVSANGGVIVGQGTSASGFEAFRWTSGGGLVGLGDLAGGSFNSNALATSSDGSVVVGFGSSTASGSSNTEAFRWTQAGGMVGLGFLPGSTNDSIAYGTSADGSVVVGYGHSASTGLLEAFRWTQAGGMVGLGGRQSYAQGVSADGAVVVGQNDNLAFRWTAAGGMVSLGDLFGGSDFSNAVATSSDGSTVVGWGYTASGRTAMRWTPSGGMQNMKDYLVAGGANLSGWTLTQTNAVSADGSIYAGFGVNPSGQTEGWYAQVSNTVIPEPGTLALLSLGLLGSARILRRKHSLVTAR